jgi:hypothetical protein
MSAVVSRSRALGVGARAVDGESSFFVVIVRMTPTQPSIVPDARRAWAVDLR